VRAGGLDSPDMPLEGHWERVNTPLRRTTKREGRLIAVVAALLVAAALAVGVYAVLDDSASKPGPGCIEVTAAHARGGATIQACGADAARWCRIVAPRDDSLALKVKARCRDAGYR
jgi:hypothetical protein